MDDFFFSSDFGSIASFSRDLMGGGEISTAETIFEDVVATNISSKLKTKSSLRAPGNDLPPVDLTLPPTEPVRIPTIHTSEKKRPAPKKPAGKKEKAAPPTTTSPEAVVPATTNEVETQQSRIVPTIEVKTEEELLIQSPVSEKQVEEETTIRPATPSPAVVDEQTNIRSPTPPPVIEAPPVEEIKVQSTTDIEKQPVEAIKVCLTLRK